EPSADRACRTAAQSCAVLLHACSSEGVLGRRVGIRRKGTGSRLMTTTAHFRTQQWRRLSPAGMLFLMLGPYVSMTAALSSTQLSAVDPAMFPRRASSGGTHSGPEGGNTYGTAALGDRLSGRRGHTGA